MTESTTSQMTVLVADDDPLVRAVLRMALAELGHAVVEARTVTEVGQLAPNASIGLAIVDVHMPGGTVEDTITALDARLPPCPVLVLSGNEPPVLDGRQVTFARKPLDLAEFTTLVQRLLRRDAVHGAEHAD